MNCYVSNYHHCYCCCHWHQQYIDIHFHLNFVVIIINKYWSAQLYIHRHVYKCIIAHTNNLTTRFVLNFVLRQWLTNTHYYRSTATGAIWNNIYEYESESPNMMNLLSINESPRKHKKRANILRDMLQSGMVTKRPFSKIPWCTYSISHNAPFKTICAHLCSEWLIVGYRKLGYGICDFGVLSINPLYCAAVVMVAITLCY